MCNNCVTQSINSGPSKLSTSIALSWDIWLFLFCIPSCLALSWNMQMIYIDGISSGNSLHAWSTVAAPIESSDNACWSLVTFNPPCENAHSTSQEEAEDMMRSVTKSIYSWRHLNSPGADIKLCPICARGVSLTVCHQASGSLTVVIVGTFRYSSSSSLIVEEPKLSSSANNPSSSSSFCQDSTLAMARNIESQQTSLVPSAALFPWELDTDGL